MRDARHGRGVLLRLTALLAGAAVLATSGPARAQRREVPPAAYRGATAVVQHLDTCSTAYTVGEIAAYVHGILSGAAAARVARVAARGRTAAIERVVAGSGGSIRQAITGVNRAGLSQLQAVQAITRVIQASGRSVGGVVDVAGGARVVTGVVQGSGQPIVPTSARETATFGSTDVAFGVDTAGNVVTRVTNIVLP